MKRIFLATICALCIQIVNAQDTIMLHNNTVIIARVSEIGSTEIKYKKFENTDGPLYTITKDEVRMIKYENGSTDVFTVHEKIPQRPSGKPQGTLGKEPGTAAIYVTLSVPMGSFSDASEGGALLGWGLGLSGASGFSGNSAYFSYQISYSNHPYEFNGSFNGGSYSLTGDYNAWHFLVGAGKRGRSSSMPIYLNVMAGLNYTSVTGVLAQAGYSDAVALALGLGTGVIIDRSVNIGIKFLYSNASFENNKSSSYNAEQKISMFQLTGGFQF